MLFFNKHKYICKGICVLSIVYVRRNTLSTQFLFMSANELLCVRCRVLRFSFVCALLLLRPLYAVAFIVLYTLFVHIKYPYDFNVVNRKNWFAAWALCCIFHNNNDNTTNKTKSMPIGCLSTMKSERISDIETKIRVFFALCFQNGVSIRIVFVHSPVNLLFIRLWRSVRMPSICFTSNRYFYAFRLACVLSGSVCVCALCRWEIICYWTKHTMGIGGTFCSHPSHSAFFLLFYLNWLPGINEKPWIN